MRQEKEVVYSVCPVSLSTKLSVGVRGAIIHEGQSSAYKAWVLHIQCVAAYASQRGFGLGCT